MRYKVILTEVMSLQQKTLSAFSAKICYNFEGFSFGMEEDSYNYMSVKTYRGDLK